MTVVEKVVVTVEKLVDVWVAEKASKQVVPMENSKVAPTVFL